jgi:polysaccharide export outer membrane protein
MSARLLLLLLVVSVAAGVSGASALEQSLIGIGDTLKITVLSEPDQSRNVVVDLSGRISLPLAKDIVVAGLSTSDAAEAIAQTLSKFMKNPNVTVEIAEKAKKVVTITGQVRTPGVYPIDREMNLIEAVGLAGGFAEMADLTRVTVTRRGGTQPTICDLQAFLAGTLATANLIVQDGDVIGVPEKNPALGTVFVYGAVRQPGTPIPIRDGMRLSQAVSAAGGVLLDQADLTRATLVHQGQSQMVTLDLAKALAGDANADMALRPGDTITVPGIEQSGTYTIYGAVQNSGEFPLKMKTTISKVVAAAGASPSAKIKDVRLTRVDPASGKTQAMRVNLNRINTGTAPDVEVRPGDTIYVPQEPPKQDIARWAAIAISVAAILLRL